MFEEKGRENYVGCELNKFKVGTRKHVVMGFDSRYQRETEEKQFIITDICKMCGAKKDDTYQDLQIK